jgi:hypothetical protein
MVNHRGERTEGRQDLGALVRSIVDSNLCMTLATADAADVTALARHRLYRATASTHFLLGGDDERIEAIP